MNVLINAVANIVNLVLTIYMWIVVARALVSWVNPDPYNPIVRFLHSVTDPVLYKLRRYLPFLQLGAFDLSPIALLVIISVLQQLLIAGLRSLAY